MEAPQREPRFLVTQYQFDDMHLRVGDRFQLESHAHPVQRHYGSLVGFLAGQSVLVKTPFVNGLPVPYTDHQALTARAFTGMGIFAFDTAVQRVCVSPFHYLHLDFPSEVRGVQIRSTERVKVTMPTQATVTGTQVPGMITDIGIGGAMLEFDRKLHAGDPLKVYVTFALEQMQIKAGFEAEAKVHRQLESTQPDQAIPLHRYGLEFENLTLGQRVMLQNFVYHQLLQDHQLLI
jgi:c-di-GMP-binding flagellar brake protein YcgR